MLRPVSSIGARSGAPSLLLVAAPAVWIGAVAGAIPTGDVIVSHDGELYRAVTAETEWSTSTCESTAARTCSMLQPVVDIIEVLHAGYRHRDSLAGNRWRPLKRYG